MKFPSDLTRDGAQLLFVQDDLGGAVDIFALDLDGSRQTHALLATDAYEQSPSMSPDGRWVAYESNDEGQREVYVGPFPDLASRRKKISAGGGTDPLWSLEGDEIFFRDAKGNMMAAQVTLEPTFDLGKVVQLFPNPGTNSGGTRSWDVSPLTGRFLMRKQLVAPPLGRLVVVLNWFQELEAKVPSDR
jgi:Tol biopolymer transport system component